MSCKNDCQGDRGCKRNDGTRNLAAGCRETNTDGKWGHHTSRPTKIELCRSRAVGTRTPGTMFRALAHPSSRRSDRIPSGGRAVSGEEGEIFSLHEHPGRQCRWSPVLLTKPEGALRMSVNHSLVEYRQAATGKGEGEPATSRNQTSLSTVAAVRMDSIMMSDEYEATELFCKCFRQVLDVEHLLSPVRDQQQIFTSRKGMCALVLLTSPSTPRLYRLRT